MNPFEIVNPPALGEPRGWNNGMLGPPGGRVLFVAGQVAIDGSGHVPEGVGFVEQFGGALGNALEVVRAAGGGPEHVGRLTIFVTDMGKNFPAMALMEVKSLVEPHALVEIEATAVLPA